MEQATYHTLLWPLAFIEEWTREVVSCLTRESTIVTGNERNLNPPGSFQLFFSLRLYRQTIWQDPVDENSSFKYIRMEIIWNGKDAKKLIWLWDGPKRSHAGVCESDKVWCSSRMSLKCKKTINHSWYQHPVLMNELIFLEASTNRQRTKTSFVYSYFVSQSQ